MFHNDQINAFSFPTSYLFSQTSSYFPRCQPFGNHVGRMSHPVCLSVRLSVRPLHIMTTQTEDKILHVSARPCMALQQYLLYYIPRPREGREKKRRTKLSFNVKVCFFYVFLSSSFCFFFFFPPFVCGLKGCLHFCVRRSYTGTRYISFASVHCLIYLFLLTSSRLLVEELHRTKPFQALYVLWVRSRRCYTYPSLPPHAGGNDHNHFSP